MATASVSSRSTTASRPENLDTMLPGPASRNNNGCCDCSLSGLLVYGAGSGAVVVDPRSMQLVSVLPMPSPFTSSSSGTGSVAPFVTAVRWSPHTLPRDLVGSEEEVLANLHFRLAVGDRQGRIAIWDFRSKQIVLWLESDDRSKLAIQDLCWFRSDMWSLASISGPSLLSLWDISTGRCFWKYDCSPELFSCIRRDPFDPHHFCVLGLRGFLLSVRVFGNKEDNVAINEQQIPLSSDLLNEIQKLEKDSSASSTTPAFAAFPHFFAKFCFSPRWKYIIHVTFPKELVSYDLQYGTSLSSFLLPRGMGKFMDVVPDMDDDFLYCAHLDGKLSTWKCREGDLVSMLCTVEELIPLIGTAVPSPCVLAIIICQYESTIQNIGKLCSDLVYTPALPGTLDLKGELVISGNRHLMSISDDGKVWNWLLTSENARVHQKMASRMDPNINSIPDFGYNLVKDSVLDASVPRIDATASKLSFKISLIGQLHLLSSTVVTLAVPSPSLTATLARGGNNPAAAVPLVALGTQNGTIDIIDVFANAVAASFSVHSSIIRGLRWLGNSRLVSFSYSQASDKGGGYANKLVVTCVRSGLNRTFRVLQKPERAPVRALRASSSGRYLLVMFRDAPVEVWAMTKNPIMLRSLALPFTVLEWTLPTAPRPTQHGSSIKSQPVQREHSAAASANTSLGESKMTTTDASGEDTSESFAFALVNGALGVFEVQGRRIRDFRPKWPSSSFVSSDGLVTAMAYRQPHVVMGDRLGYIRWWDVTSGLSSSFYTHKEGIRRIKFSPVVPGDRSRGRVAVLFFDNSFSIFDLDTPDPLANALLQPQSTGTLVVELDWLPTRTSKDEPLVLCIAGADSSFRLIEININETKSNSLSKSSFLKERFRPMPLCLPILFPTAHVLALRMVLQFGVKSSWFKTLTTNVDKFLERIPDTDEVSNGDLRSYMVESSLPPIGDSVVPELFLKVLESYRREGYLLDRELAGLYSSIVNKGCVERLAFSAAIFGEFQEAFFWLQLPRALRHSLDKEVNKSFLGEKISVPDTTNMSKLIEATSEDNFPSRKHHPMQNIGQLNLMAFEQAELWRSANERIPWHEKLDGDDAIQKRVHELVSVGNLEAAVTLLLSTPPEGPHFYPNALRAIALSSAVSRSLHELAVKVVAANMVRTDKSFTGIHLLCAVGRYQEACSQLQDAGCWTDAATLAATHLQGSDYARMLQRWAHHVLHSEHNLWRAVILYVAAGAMREALAALRDSKHPDTAAMFLLACHEIYAQITSKPGNPDNTLENIEMDNQTLVLPYMNEENEDVMAASEYFGQYQRKLVHLCMDEAPFFD